MIILIIVIIRITAQAGGQNLIFIKIILIDMIAMIVMMIRIIMIILIIIIIDRIMEQAGEQPLRSGLAGRSNKTIAQ